MNVLNDGQLASGSIGVNIIITGPQNFDFGETASALSPGQSEQVSFMFSSVTGATGSYTANAFATFISNNVIEQSNTASATYSVIQTVTPPSSPPPTQPPVVTLPQLELTQVPFYSSLVIGSAALTNMGFKNLLTVPETVIMKIPQEFAKILGLTAYNLYLMPNESLSVQVVFNSNNIEQPGVYAVPVNISVRALNGTPTNVTQYITYAVERSTYNVSLYNQVSTSNGNATVQPCWWSKEHQPRKRFARNHASQLCCEQHIDK